MRDGPQNCNLRWTHSKPTTCWDKVSKYPTCPYLRYSKLNLKLKSLQHPPQLPRIINLPCPLTRTLNSARQNLIQQTRNQPDKPLILACTLIYSPKRNKNYRNSHQRRTIWAFNLGTQLIVHGREWGFDNEFFHENFIIPRRLAMTAVIVKLWVPSDATLVW